MKTPTLKSSCCNAELVVHQDSEGTGYYSCSTCLLACDVASETRKCTDCKQEKAISEFYKSSYEKYGLDRRCKSCCSIVNKKKQLKPDRRWYRYVNSAKNRNMEFTITREQFDALWMTPCYYCGASIETIGLDRVDNSVGYTKENTVSCCKICNYMKSNMSVDQFISHCKLIVTNKPTYGTPSTISEIVSSIVLLAHSKGVANEGFVNVDFYIEQLEKEVEKTRQEAVKQDREHILKLSQSKRPETSWQRWLVETLALSSQKEVDHAE